MDLASLGIKIDSSQAKEAFADLEKLAGAGADAEKAVAGVGSAGKTAAAGLGQTSKAAKDASKSIDDYVKKLQLTATTNGMSAREAKLYELALQGASKAQLQAADHAIKLNDSYQRGVEIGEKVRSGFAAIGTAAAAMGVALAAAAVAGKLYFDKIADSVAKYQELSEKTGESASNIQALQQAATLSGVSLDTVATASIRLTAALSKTDDESKLVAKGIKALGLNFDDFKKLGPKDQLESVATAMSGFADGSEKAAAAVAIFGKAGAELIPFFNDLAESGEGQIRLTNEQIKLADDYTKAQAKVRGEIEAMAQVIVVNSIPAVTDLTGAIKDVIKELTGLGGASGDLGNNDGIQRFAEEGAHALATLVDYAVKAGQAIHGIGDTIGAGLAFNANLLKGNISEAVSVAKDYYSTIGKTFDGPSLADAFDKRVAARKAQAAQPQTPDAAKPRIDASGLNMDRAPKGRKDNSAAQEAKAQLAYDLEDIKKAQDAITNTYANSEKVLEAKRSANLVDEKEYYGEKKKLLELNNQAQQDGLEKELARLQQENLSGKDKINNDRKILDVQAQLTKARANAATASQVLAIQEEAAYKKIADAIKEARISAQDYLDTTKRKFDRDLAGIGKGDQSRERDALKNTTDDNFLGQRQSLERDKRRNQITPLQYEEELKIIQEAHQKALALDDAYFDEKLKKQKDFALGAKEALQNYYDDSQNVFKQTQEAVTNAFKGMEDALVEFVTTGKLDFKGLIDSILKDVARMAIKQTVTGPLANMLSGALGGGDSSSGGGGIGGLISSLFGGLAGTRAIGGPVSANSMYQVNEKGPELFNVAGKQYLMTGSQGGSIDPNTGGGGGGGSIHYSPTFILNEPPSRKTQDQIVQRGYEGLRRMQRNV
jgi:lambda family phage tail tape measure protein